LPKFPVDAPKTKVVKALTVLGFRIVREREHIALVRDNPDGTQTPLTMPIHRSKVRPCGQFALNQEFRALIF